MSSAPVVASYRRRRLAVLFATLALLVVAAGACTGPRDPKSYGTSVEKHFVAGCLTGLVPAGTKTDPQAKAHRTSCTCLYKQLSHPKTGIPFATFESAQAKIRADPNAKANRIDKLIPGYEKYVAACTGLSPVGP